MREFQTKNFQKLFYYSDVHDDDIHVIEKLNEKSFITGSKDKCVKLWEQVENEEQDLQGQNLPTYHKQSWITALKILNNGNWVTGSRNGHFSYYDNLRKKFFSIDLKTKLDDYASPSYKCKSGNFCRINCIQELDEETLLIGIPTGFLQIKIILDQNLKIFESSFTKVNENDWVYCIQVLSLDKILVVIGARLEVWKFDRIKSCWILDKKLIEEKKINKKSQREFISSLTKFTSNKSLYLLSIFGGGVKVLNIENENFEFESCEHEKRVWMSIEVNENCFASCSDDGYIKLWDIRKTECIKSVRDDKKKPSRVSVLLRLNSLYFISGSCPDDNSAKAKLSFWDIRTI